MFDFIMNICDVSFISSKVNQRYTRNEEFSYIWNSKEIKDYAKEVAEALGETDEQPISQIEMLIERLGRDFVQQHLEETQKIEADGGLKTDDNKRRRTMGGVSSTYKTQNG